MRKKQVRLKSAVVSAVQSYDQPENPCLVAIGGDGDGMALQTLLYSPKSLEP
jgi:hypothetical protein